MGGTNRDRKPSGNSKNVTATNKYTVIKLRGPSCYLFNFFATSGYPEKTNISKTISSETK